VDQLWAHSITVVSEFIELAQPSRRAAVVARWSKPSAKEWAWATIGVLSFPAQFIYANAVMSEILLQTAVMLLAGAAWLFIKIHKARYFAGVTAAAILAFYLSQYLRLWLWYCRQGV
jgi:hypothetical protein